MNRFERRLKAQSLKRSLGTPKILNFTKTDSIEFIPGGEVNLKCYAHSLENCEGPISKEHFISKSILQQFEKIVPKGVPWLSHLEGSIPYDALVTKCLCKKHNSVLSPLDVAASNVFEQILRFSTVQNERVILPGNYFERWMLKCLFGFLATGKCKFRDKYYLPSDVEADWVTATQLKDVIIAGETAKNNASPLHPKMFPGYCAYAERVKALRELLLPQEWKPITEKGLEMIVSPDGRTAILTSVGDESTGDPNKELKTKNRKGEHTRELVEINNQLSFFDDVLVDEQEVSLEERNYWYLMVKTTTDEIRYELVRPIKIDEENRLCGFSERIILDPIKLGNLAEAKRKSDDHLMDEPSDDIVVVVSKKD